METSQEIGHGRSWECELSTLINGGTGVRNFAKKDSTFSDWFDTTEN